MITNGTGITGPVDQLRGSGASAILILLHEVQVMKTRIRAYSLTILLSVIAMCFASTAAYSQLDIEQKDKAGLFAISRDGKWGFIDSSGKVVIEPQFEAAYPFTEGLSRIQLNGEWGYINREGALVIKAQFDGADRFSEGLARVQAGHKWGYIDTTGKYVFEPCE